MECRARYSRLQVLGAVCRLRMRGNRDHGNARIFHACIGVANSASSLIAVHLRHLAIHQHDNETRLTQRLQCFDAVDGDLDLGAELLQQPRGQL